MLFLDRKIDGKIYVGDDSWVRFCGLSDGDAFFVICDEGKMRNWRLMMNGPPYHFLNGTSMQWTGFSRWQATLGFDVPDNIDILREEVKQRMESNERS